MGQGQNAVGFATEKEAKLAQVVNSFSYHSPFGSQPQRFENLRNEARKLAQAIIENTPTSREQAVAITRLEEAVMWANKAIACNETEAIEKPVEAKAA